LNLIEGKGIGCAGFFKTYRFGHSLSPHEQYKLNRDSCQASVQVSES
jgi:hypothetical protein